MAQTNNNDHGSKPNIVYIVFDDTGFSDFGCYGSEIKTPHIDNLADDGLRYNQFNVTPLCSPTRASLLTGRNAHSVGFGYIAEADLGPEYPHTRGRITPAAATLAEILKENGFNTYAAGKWHLAPAKEISAVGPFHNWPLEKGFQRFYGFLQGKTDQYEPDLVSDNHRIERPDKPDYHLTEDLVDNSIQFITDHVSVTPDNPFFLYLAFGAQHEPHQVSKEYIDMYKGQYDKGWDEIRKERFARQKEMGIVPEDSKLAPHNPGVKEWDSLSDDEKKLFARLQETYAGFLTHTDEQIGRLLDYLKTVGQMENTLVVLLADNGANHQGLFNGSLNSSLFFNNLGEQSVSEMLENIDEIGQPGTEPNYPLGWAQAGNTPFKYYKGNTHHGGIRVPFIMNWPKKIQDKGGIRDQYHHVSDVTPTVLDALGIEAPEVYKGVEQIPMQGVSMTYTFDKPDTNTNKETQHYLMSGHRAIWHEGWKAVTLHERGTDFDKDEWELYHVDQDFSEVNDLANKYPEKLRELQVKWWEEADKYGALPLVEGGITNFTTDTRNTSTFYPGMSHVPIAYAPNIINRSFTITVPIERNSEDDEGVLIAQGHHGSGYTFYVHNNRLIFEYNYVGTIYRLESEEKISTGKNIVRFEFKKTDDFQGIGSLYINDERVGEGHFPETMPLLLSLVGIDVGHDDRGEVSINYPSDTAFPFTGEIEKVQFRLEDD